MTFEGLPKQFLSSVRVLFDVLDTRQLGFIEFRDVESKWNKENTEKLPTDVVECLRSVTPPTGQLTFELFVTGLQKSLTKRNYSKDEVFEEPPPKPMKPSKLQHRANSNPYLQYSHKERLDTPEPLYQSPKGDKQFDANRSQSMADIPAQPITSPQHRPTYIESDLYRRQVPKRRESSRRHTLGHGVDGSMIRRSKLLEEERRMLLKGLQSVDKAKEWYSKRLAEVADKQRYGAPETSDQSNTDQQQERINFEQLRITELSQQIDALTEPDARRGGVMRMNLARPFAATGPAAGADRVVRQQMIPYEPKSSTSSAGADSDPSHALQLTRAQNRMLTKEVSQKSDKISQLEKDKAALLRDLFEVRAKNRVHHHQQHNHQQQQQRSGGGQHFNDTTTSTLM